MKRASLVAVLAALTVFALAVPAAAHDGTLSIRCGSADFAGSDFPRGETVFHFAVGGAVGDVTAKADHDGQVVASFPVEKRDGPISGRVTWTADESTRHADAEATLEGCAPPPETTTTVASTTTVPPETTTAVPVPPQPRVGTPEELPRTGSSVVPFAIFAGVLSLAGVAMQLQVRRGRET